MAQGPGILVGLSDEVISESRLDSAEVRKIGRVAKNLVGRYISSASLMNSDGEFDNKRFTTITQELFLSDADIYNYLLDKPKRVSISEFAAFVLRYLPNGVEIEPEEAEITGIRKNASGDFEIDVQLRLTVFGSINDKNQFSKLVKGRDTNLKALIIAENGNEENAKFLKIEGVTEKVRQPGLFSTVSFGIQYISGNLIGSTGNSANFTNVIPDLSGIGFTLNYCKSTRFKNIMLWAGAHYSTCKINTSFNSDNYSGPLGKNDDNQSITYRYFNGASFQNGNTPAFIQVDKINKALETLEGISIIELIAGVKYKINVGTNDRLMVGVAVSPRFGLNAGTGLRTLDFNGYLVPIDLKKFPDLKELVENSIISEYEVKSNLEIDRVSANPASGISALTNISYQKHLSFKWGFEAGLGYRVDFSNFLKFNDIQDPSLVRGESIIEDFFPQNKFRGVFAQVGIFYKMGRYF